MGLAGPANWAGLSPKGLGRMSSGRDWPKKYRLSLGPTGHGP